MANIDTTGTTSTIAYVTADQLGTPRAVADINGNTEWQLPYQGNPWNEVSPTSTGYTYNLGFPGQYFDAETGLFNNVNRDYCPACGRYIESDPIGLLGGSNTYDYGLNDPLKYIDPTGRDAILMINPWGAYLGPLGMGTYGGHAGVAVGDDNNGWTFYSEGGLDDNGNQITTMLQYPNLAAMENALMSAYTVQYGEHTSPLQDILMNTWAKQHLHDPYSARSNNCGDFAANVLRSGGLNPTANRIGPTIPNDMGLGLTPNDPNLFDPLEPYRAQQSFTPNSLPPGPTDSMPYTLGNPNTY